MTTEQIRIPVGGNAAIPCHVARPAVSASQPSGNTERAVGVIVAHELFGATPDIRSVADDLASEGYLTIVPEFYHRHAPAGHWLEHDDAGVKEGFSYLHRLTRQDALDDVAACLGWLRAQPGITRTAIVGFSAGGHLAYLAACELPVDRTAVLYGGWLPVTDIPMSQPRPTLDLTPGISGRLLYLVGEDDFLVDAAQREAIARALHDAPGGDGHELVSYPGVAHAFWWPGTPEYDKQARDDAWSRILKLLAG